MRPSLPVSETLGRPGFPLALGAWRRSRVRLQHAENQLELGRRLRTWRWNLQGAGGLRGRLHCSLFLSNPVSAFFPSVPILQEIRQLQQKQESYIREISDLQETIEWKDKKIGVGLTSL